MVTQRWQQLHQRQHPLERSIMDIKVFILRFLMKEVNKAAGDSLRLAVKDGKLRASVTCGDLWMESWADHGFIEPSYGSCPIFIPYRDLKQLLVGMEAPATIKFVGKDIKYEGITYSLGEAEEFAVAKPLARTVNIAVDPIRNLMPFVEEGYRSEISGVNVKAGPNLLFSGTNGRILKQLDMGKTRAKFDVTIPYLVAKILSASRADKVRCGHSKTKLSFQYDTITLVTKPNDREYAAVNKVFGGVVKDIKVTVNREKLMAAVSDVSRVLTLRDKYPNKGIVFDVSDSLTISAKYTYGRAKVTIETDNKGSGRFMLNPSLLYSLLDSTDTDQVTFFAPSVHQTRPGPPIEIVGADHERMVIQRMLYSER